MYKIRGMYRGHTEEIDTAETASEADYLAAEYRTAFGSKWSVWIEEP